MTAELSVQLTLALLYLVILYKTILHFIFFGYLFYTVLGFYSALNASLNFIINPSAGIGRQDELKLR
jgi:hypothetical protein